jgi:hypothetical protein
VGGDLDTILFSMDLALVSHFSFASLSLAPPPDQHISNILNGPDSLVQYCFSNSQHSSIFIDRVGTKIFAVARCPD